MSYTVMQIRAVRSLNLDSLNRSFVYTAPMQQGMIFTCGARSTDIDEAEVFIPEPITADANNVWIAYEADIVETISGDGEKVYRGIDPDIRDFIIPANRTFSAFKLADFDIISLFNGTDDNSIISGTYTDGVQNYLIPDTSVPFGWAWTTTEADFCLKVIEPDYMSIANGGTLGGLQRNYGYRYEVVIK